MSEYNSETANAVIANPEIRKIMNWVLSVIGIVLGLVVVVDASSVELDFASWTTPALAGYGFLAGVFGFAVVSPNIPKSE